MKRRSLILLFIIFAIVLSQYSCFSQPLPYKVSGLNLNNIDKHVRFFTGLKSRFTGYPDYYKALNYIREHFEKIGLEPHVEYFDVVVPIEEYAYIKLETGEIIEAHLLYPLGPCAGSVNISGKLVYVGSGALKELKGMHLNGCIAVIEFESLWEWRVLPQLGAKAVIFLEAHSPRKVIYRMLASYKLSFTPLPLTVTRLYVTKDYREKILEACKKGLKAEISCKMHWKKVKAANIWAIIPGTDSTLREEYIAIVAHFDSFSIVPAIAPGATDSIGISVLLELARVLVENPPPRSVVIVALSGHWQYLAGAREFAEKRLEDILSGEGVAGKIKLMIELDLSTVSSALSARNFGYGYWVINTQTGLLIKYSWLKTLLDKARSRLESEAGRKYEFYNVLMAAPPTEELWQMIMRLMAELCDLYPAQLDIEPWTVAGGLGIALRTVKSHYPYLLTPLDTYDKLNYWNLVPQLDLVSAILSEIFSVPKWSMLSQPKYGRFIPPDMGLCRLVVRILEYDLKTATYHPVQGALVFATRGIISVPEPPSWYPFTLVGVTDNNGEVVFVGARYSAPYRACAFLVSEDGRIIGVAPYSGPYAIWRWTVNIYNETTVITLTLSRNISVVELYGPYIRTSFSMPIEYRIYDARTHYIPQPFQYPCFYDQHDSVFFVPSDTPIEIIAQRSGAYLGVGLTGVSELSYQIAVSFKPPIGVISGLKEPAPMGKGFALKKGEVCKITLGALRFAEETWLLNEYRLRPVAWTNASTQALALTFHKLTERELAKVEKHLSEGDLGKALAEMSVAFFFEANAYQATITLIMDVLQMSAIFVLLLVPFTYLLTNLVFREKGAKKKTLFAAAVVASTVGLFIVIHPISILATNTFMVVGGYLTLAFGLALTFIVMSKTYGQLREIRRERIGIHFIERERASIVEALSEVSLGYMNRRALRTSLTLISIICVGFALLSFSTMSVSIRPIYVKVPGDLTYRGIMLRMPDFSPIPLTMADLIEVLFSDKATIATRAWLYPPGGEIYLTRIVYKGETPIVKKALLRAILAVSPEEEEFTRLDKTLIAGEWFEPWDYRVCIISDYMAKNLGLEVGDTIDFLGIPLVVKGIFDSNLLNSIHDIDRTQLTPIDLMVPGVQEHALASYVIIIPYSLARDLIPPAHFATTMEEALTGPGVRSIVFVPKEGVDLMKLAEEIALITQGTLWVCNGKEVYVVSVTPGLRLLGSAEVAVVVALAVLVLFVTILNSIAERVKEIGILSSLGLSPSHVAQLYLLEMAIYGVLGGVLAYVASLALVAILAIFNVPTMGLYTNYTASGTLLVLGVMFLTIISTTLYPAYKASKLVTPSLERKWKISTKPKGDLWNIPLPLRLASKVEAVAFLEYIGEYFDYRRAERVGNYQIIGYKLKPGRKEVLAEIVAKCQLAPWDYGIVQLVDLKCFELEGAYSFELVLKRLSGPYSSWIISTKSLIGDIRLQILMWRSLRDEEKKKYLVKARELLERWGI